MVFQRRQYTYFLSFILFTRALCLHSRTELIAMNIRLNIIVPSANKMTHQPRIVTAEGIVRTLQTSMATRETQSATSLTMCWKAIRKSSHYFSVRANVINTRQISSKIKTCMIGNQSMKIMSVAKQMRLAKKVRGQITATLFGVFFRRPEKRVAQRWLTRTADARCTLICAYSVISN